jgi:hypothetical protein
MSAQVSSATVNTVHLADPSRIDLGVDYELAFWCRHWGLAAEDIREAVEQVGDRSADVARLLSKPL